MTAVRPFADAVAFYRAAGWSGTLPLPPRSKEISLTGWTGGHERDPDDATVAYWAANGQADGNIALRMPVDIIGIDVDAYEAWRPKRDPDTGATVRGWVHKRGAETLAEMERLLGPLPATWISSARSAPSGIRLFRVPPGVVITESALPGDIEIIRRGHRYLVAPPSINPETDTAYGWWFGSSSAPWFAPGRPPRVDEIPWLTMPWAQRLSARPLSQAAPVSEFFQPVKTADTAARQWARLADRFVGFVRRCEMFGWGGDAHGQLLELTREVAQLAPEHAHRAVGEWFTAGGAGYVDHRVWAMLDTALGKYPADKIVAPAPAEAHTAGFGEMRGATQPPHTGSATAPSGQGMGAPITAVGSGGPVPLGTIAATHGPATLSGPIPDSPGTRTAQAPLPGTGPDRPAEVSVAASGTAPKRLPMIPDAVWDAYGWTRSIRAHARAADVCPDAVLGASLASYASRIPPGVRIFTGTKMPLGCNLVVSLVGPSGSDKSTAFNLVSRMMPGSSVPVVNNPGSGEAFAATFTHPDPEGDGAMGKRRQVLKPDPRALFYVAEGALLGSIGARLGSTWLPHLRSLAVDESLSTTNATAAINRQVPAMSYRAGVVVGFQVTTATTILHDTGTGTAQRFLWFTSLSSEDLPPGAGADAPEVPMATPVITRLAAGIDEHNEPIHHLTVTQSITERIKAEQRHARLTRDIASPDDHDAHRHTLVAKLAAIAVLADGRVMIDEADWLWAEALYAASAATRDVLLDIAEERAETDRATVAQQQGKADRVRKGVDSAETRVAEVIMRRSAKVGPATRRQLRDGVNIRDRALFAGAFDLLVTHGWLADDGSGKFYTVSRNTDQ